MKIQKKIIIGFSLLSAVLVSSISVSVAWFVSGNNALVSDIDLTMASLNKNLLISTKPDLDSFKEYITKEEAGTIESGFLPVTSMYSTEWLEKKEPIPHFKANPTAGGEFPVVSEATGGYYTKAFYLYSTYAGYGTIDSKETIFKGDDEKNWETAKELLPYYEEETLESIFEKLSQVPKTLRFSILVPDEEHYQYTIVEPVKERKTNQAGVLDTQSDGYFDYYKNPITGLKYETVYGEVEDRSKIVYDDPVDYDIPSTEIFVAKHKANTYRLNVEKSIANGAGFAIENSYTLEEAEARIRIPLTAYKPSKFYISLYLEGWDIDTINSTMFASFLATIKFKIL